MESFPLTPEWREISRRVVWFEEPDVALAGKTRFLIYAMTYARFQDMQFIRRVASDDDLRAALREAPPGIIDARSWTYWHLVLGIDPAPPLPVRHVPRFEKE